MSMGSFNRGSSGGRSFGRRDFGGRGFDRSADRQMHKTICSKCGKECEVPFVPTGSRPVFCRDCFQSNRVSEPMRSETNYPRRPNFDDRNSGQVIRPIGQPQYKEQFEALNLKLDRILRILEPKVISAPDEIKEIKSSKSKKATKKSAVEKIKE